MYIYATIVCSLAAAAYYVYSAGKRRKRESIRGKLILLTGGGSGIGAELAYRLAVREGALVFVLDVDKKGLHATRQRIEAEGGKCSTFECDVTQREQVSSLVEMLEARGQAVDVLINNAGVAVKKPFIDSSDEELERTFRVNVFAHFYTIRAVLGGMLRRRAGQVVQVSSVMDSLATSSLAAYGASKWAVTGFTEALREELAGSDVTLTLVRPWILSTPMFDQVNFWRHPWVGKVLPPTTVSDVAEAIIDAIAFRKDSVTVPGHLSVLGVVFQLLPSSFRTRLVRQLGLNRLI